MAPSPNPIVNVIAYVVLLFALSFVGGVIIKHAVRVVCRFRLPFRTAYQAAFVAYLFSICLTFGLEAMERIAPMSVTLRMAIPSLAVFLFQAFFFSRYIKDPEAVPIGIAKGAVVALMHTVVLTIIFIAAMAIFVTTGQRAVGI